jgi:hypothetical protein
VATRKASGEITDETVSEIVWASGGLTICRHVPKKFDDDDEE